MVRFWEKACQRCGSPDLYYDYDLCEECYYYAECRVCGERGGYWFRTSSTPLNKYDLCEVCQADIDKELDDLGVGGYHGYLGHGYKT